MIASQLPSTSTRRQPGRRFAKLSALLSSGAPVKHRQPGSAAQATRPSSDTATPAAARPQRAAVRQSVAAPRDPAAAARAAERQRLFDVFTSEHVAGREMRAVFLLTSTRMTAADVSQVLALYPSSRTAEADAKAKIGAIAARGNFDPADKYGWDDIHTELQMERTR